MSAFIVAILIMVCGAIVGAMLMWWYMDGRVDYWREKAELEQGLKEKLLEQNLKMIDKTMTIFHDLRGAIK